MATKGKARATAAARKRQAQRRQLRQLALALAAVTVLAVAFVVLRSGDDKPTASGSGRTIGPDLHSIVALADGRLFIGGHDGVTTSTDDGHTWQPVASLSHADAMGWGAQDATVFVSGHPGLNVSTDGGSVFQRNNAGLPNTDVHSFGAGRTMLYGASPAAGFFASTDHGTSWQVVAAEAGRSFFGRILVDPADDAHLVAADAQAGPVETKDGGRTWRALGGVRQATWVSTSDTTMHTLIASGPAGAAVSRDSGQTWQPLVLPSGAQLVEAGKQNSKRLYAAGVAGDSARIWVSDDDGGTWTEQ